MGGGDAVCPGPARVDGEGHWNIRNTDGMDWPIERDSASAGLRGTFRRSRFIHPGSAGRGSGEPLELSWNRVPEVNNFCPSPRRLSFPPREGKIELWVSTIDNSAKISHLSKPGVTQ
jgi:hypothetical protein